LKKAFFKDGSTFKPIVFGMGSCLATDRITVDGKRVGFMYREPPDDSFDSGWRFFAGDESQEYCDNPLNLALYDVNTIANYDPEITPYLDFPAGTALVRNGSEFIAERAPLTG
jgi:hypothetical protein